MTASNLDSKDRKALDCKPRARTRRKPARIHYKRAGREGALIETSSQDTYSFAPIPDSIREILYK